MQSHSKKSVCSEDFIQPRLLKQVVRCFMPLSSSSLHRQRIDTSGGQRTGTFEYTLFDFLSIWFKGMYRLRPRYTGRPMTGRRVGPTRRPVGSANVARPLVKIAWMVRMYILNLGFYISKWERILHSNNFLGWLMLAILCTRTFRTLTPPVEADPGKYASQIGAIVDPSLSALMRSFNVFHVVRIKKTYKHVYQQSGLWIRHRIRIVIGFWY